MTTELSSIVLWSTFILVLLVIAGRRSTEAIQPPQIVYVQAEAPQNSGAAWFIIIIFGLLLLKATGAL